MILLLFLASLCYTIMTDPGSQWENLLIDKGVEAVAGHIAGDFSCVYENCNGTLYAGDAALYFVGPYFLFDKRMSIAWEDVRKVEKIEQGVTIICNNDATHQFTGLHPPDRIWALLVSMHNDMLMDRPSRRYSSTPRQMIKRRNSDPLMVSTIRMLDESIRNEEADESLLSQSTGNVPNNLAISKETARSPSDSFVFMTVGIDQTAVESIAGKLSLQPIQCFYNNVKGKLYAGQAAVYFFGRKHFWSKQEVLLTWDNIRQIQIVDAKMSNEILVSVGIHIVTKEEQIFRFLKMDSADAVWASLVGLHNENLTERIARRRPSRVLRRMNSDPTIDLQMDLDMGEFLNDASPAVSVTPRRLVKENADPADTHTESNKIGFKQNDEWHELVSDSGGYDKLAVEELHLGCSLDEFFKMFLHDAADYSTANFLETKGDTHIRASLWEGDGVNKTRVIQYTHPVNVPMAPPQANARKEQVYRRFAADGIAIWTRTFVDDVPMADCFFVSDRILVSSRSPKTVSVRMEFTITFIQSTIFRAIISKTTSSEFNKFFRSLANYMSEKLGGPSTILIKDTDAVQKETKSITEYLGSTLAIILLVMAIALHLWVLIELRVVKNGLAELQQVRVTSQNECHLRPTNSIPDYVG